MKRGLTVVAVLLALLGSYRLIEQRWGSASLDTEEGASVAGDQTEDFPSADSEAALPQVPTGSVALALEGDGLRFFAVDSGSASPIPFGTSAEMTRSALAASQGGEVVEEGESVECGNRFARLANGLTIWLRQDRFVGWSLRDPPLTTAGGIGIGSTRSDLESVYDARIVESSLGVEFTAGGLAGLLSSDRPDARVQNLWAGETCIAR